MIFLLCIETSADICAVCVSCDDHVLSHLSLDTPKAHASQLGILIVEDLRIAQITAAQLHAIVYSAGPGSYSGLRIGLSTVQGLCYGLDIKLISVNTLSYLAYKAQKIYKSEIERNKLGDFCVKYIVILDARQEIYYAVYDEELTEIIAPSAAKLTPTLFENFHEDLKIFCGSALQTQKHLLPTHQAIFLTNEQCHYAAIDLVPLGYEKYNRQQFDDIAYITPTYLKNPTYNQFK